MSPLDDPQYLVQNAQCFQQIREFSNKSFKQKSKVCFHLKVIFRSINSQLITINCIVNVPNLIFNEFIKNINIFHLLYFTH